MSPSKKLIDAIVVCAELTQTQLSRPAATVFAQDLAHYPEDQALRALTRCRRELKGRLTLGDVISRIDDGRPGAEEAWAMLPKDEKVSVVWTEEMALSYAICASLMAEDQVAARMAFREAYVKAVARARDEGRPVTWAPSLGHDPHGREVVLIEAAKHGRLSFDQVARLLPHCEAEILALEEGMPKLLERQA